MKHFRNLLKSTLIDFVLPLVLIIPFLLLIIGAFSASTYGDYFLIGGIVLAIIESIVFAAIELAKSLPTLSP